MLTMSHDTLTSLFAEGKRGTEQTSYNDNKTSVTTLKIFMLQKLPDILWAEKVFIELRKGKGVNFTHKCHLFFHLTTKMNSRFIYYVHYSLFLFFFFYTVSPFLL